MRPRIKELRTSQGLSVRDLARKARVQFMTVSRVERGLETPRLDTLEKLARALGVPIGKVISGGGK